MQSVLHGRHGATASSGAYEICSPVIVDRAIQST